MSDQDLDKILFNEELIFLDLDMDNKEELLKFMSEKLHARKYVKKSFAENLIKREHAYPTGLKANSIGLAIPHTDAEHVEKSCIAVSVLKRPIDFIAAGSFEDLVEINIVVLLALKDPNHQLVLLQNLVDLIQNEEVLRTIINSNNKKGVADIINKNLLNKI
ncbi:MAG: PTS sugar transporter subunit IIA [Clostridiaceae bacterium]|nr:PTS sugar transporter subunit IIA [Clostridiaceae bacterium]